MSAADEAYFAAEAAIAEAKRTGAQRLSFHYGAFRAIKRLPPSVATLTSLLTLSLYTTQISNLSPLAQLTALKALSLYSNAVGDLSPLAGLSGLQLSRSTRLRSATCSHWQG